MLLAVSCICAVGCGSDGGNVPDAAPADDAPPGDCMYEVSSPYDLDEYHSTIIPILIASCSAADCHAAPATTRSFKVHTDAADGNCGAVDTLDSFNMHVDFTDPGNSLVLTKLKEGGLFHGDVDAADIATLTSFIENAAQNTSSRQGQSADNRADIDHPATGMTTR